MHSRIFLRPIHLSHCAEHLWQAFFLLADNKGVCKRWKETDGGVSRQNWEESALVFMIYGELSLNILGSSDKWPLAVIDNIPSVCLSFAADKRR